MASRIFWPNVKDIRSTAPLRSRPVVVEQYSVQSARQQCSGADRVRIEGAAPEVDDRSAGRIGPRQALVTAAAPPQMPWVQGHVNPAGCVKRVRFMLPVPYPSTELKSTLPWLQSVNVNASVPQKLFTIWLGLKFGIQRP